MCPKEYSGNERRGEPCCAQLTHEAKRIDNNERKIGENKSMIKWYGGAVSVIVLLFCIIVIPLTWKTSDKITSISDKQIEMSTKNDEQEKHEAEFRTRLEKELSETKKQISAVERSLKKKISEMVSGQTK